jgi:hypothetical protein
MKVPLRIAIQITKACTYHNYRVIIALPLAAYFYLLVIEKMNWKYTNRGGSKSQDNYSPEL